MELWLAVYCGLDCNTSAVIGCQPLSPPSAAPGGAEHWAFNGAHRPGLSPGGRTGMEGRLARDGAGASSRPGRTGEKAGNGSVTSFRDAHPDPLDLVQVQSPPCLSRQAAGISVRAAGTHPFAPTDIQPQIALQLRLRLDAMNAKRSFLCFRSSEPPLVALFSRPTVLVEALGACQGQNQAVREGLRTEGDIFLLPKHGPSPASFTCLRLSSAPIY